MIALILAAAVITACLIPCAVRADRADYHQLHLTNCPDCNHDEMSTR